MCFVCVRQYGLGDMPRKRNKAEISNLGLKLSWWLIVYHPEGTSNISDIFEDIQSFR